MRPIGLLAYYYKPSEVQNNAQGAYNYVGEVNNLYDFGFGLSYSEFKYSNFAINKDTFNMSDTIKIGVFVTNDSEIDGSSYTFNDIGTFDIYAKFQNIKSDTEQVTVNQVPIEYKQYVLVEDYTGTWCGYCTRVSFAIEELKKQTKDAVVIAIHQGDPMQFSLEATLRSHFGVTGFPTAFES